MHDSLLIPLIPLNMRDIGNIVNQVKLVYFFRIEVILHTSGYD